MSYALSAIAEQQFECPQCLRFVPRDTSKNDTCFLPPKWSIDHSILTQELNKLQVHPALLTWISAFLFSRRQAVRIGNVLSQWKTLKGGIPQGTKLGVVLFMVMTNSLLTNWHLRTKFVDDTSALEIIPRNSVSLLNFAVS